jgi:hypothetical protein
MPRNPRPAWRGIGGRHAAESGAGIGRNTHRIKLGLRAVGWIESEIDAWIRERAAQIGNDMRTEAQ